MNQISRIELMELSRLATYEARGVDIPSRFAGSIKALASHLASGLIIDPEFVESLYANHDNFEDELERRGLPAQKETKEFERELAKILSDDEMPGNLKELICDYVFMAAKGK